MLSVKDNSASVAILMGCYDGEAFLPEQLESIRQQTWKRWFLVASDDGSGDATLALLNRFARQMQPGQVLVRQGPKQGFVRNFLHLACAEEIEADYFAFSDQDDIWLPGRIEKAVHMLEAWQGVPALYCSRTQLIDERGQTIGYSPLRTGAPCFQNALVQSIAGGNTMVFNRAARLLVQRAGAEACVASHDWWLYQLVSGAGGQVIYDVDAGVLYRQHDDNLVGHNRGAKETIRRLRKLWEGQFAQWNAINCTVLLQVQELLTEENRQVLSLYQQARTCSGPASVRLVRRSGVFRQRKSETAALYFSAALGKI